MIPHETMTMVEEEYKDRLDQMRRLLSAAETRVERLEAAIRTHRDKRGHGTSWCVGDSEDHTLWDVLREEVSR